jgi:hypothetical protein
MLNCNKWVEMSWGKWRDGVVAAVTFEARSLGQTVVDADTAIRNKRHIQILENKVTFSIVRLILKFKLLIKSKVLADPILGLFLMFRWLL